MKSKKVELEELVPCGYNIPDTTCCILIYEDKWMVMDSEQQRYLSKGQAWIHGNNVYISAVTSKPRESFVYNTVKEALDAYNNYKSIENMG